MTRAEQFLEQERKKDALFREGLTSQELAVEEREVRIWEDRHRAWLLTNSPSSDSVTRSKKAETKKEKTRLRVQKHRKNKVSNSQHGTALQA